MIDFSTKTKANIEKDMLSQVPNTLDTRTGSVIQTALGPAAWYIEGMYLDLANLQSNAYPATAVGESLDLIVQTRGLTRKLATPTIREGTFDAPIPEGSSFKTINGASSLNFISGTLISQSAGIYVYQMTCDVPGADGNNYTGAILPITAISGLTTATIGEILTAGTDEETDDALRTRYFATFDVASFGGNISAYRNSILAIDGVGAVQVYPAWQGGGTVLCSILGDDLKPAPAATVNNVQNIICPLEEGGVSPTNQGFGLAPIGAAVTITTAMELTLNIRCNVEFAETVTGGVELYQTEIEQKIADYIETVNETWGEPLKGQSITYPVTIYISRIIYAILTISDVVNVTNVTINGSSEDLTLTETKDLQQVAVLGTVVING